MTTSSLKATDPSLSLTAVDDPGRLSSLCELSKARLSLLVLLTTLVGFYLAAPGPVAWGVMTCALAGTALVAAGAAALNQWLERDADARMRRTAHRPLPAGHITPGFALGFGALAAGLGTMLLAFFVNGLTAILGVVTFALYLGVYTPLKRHTSLNTFVGAIPGALPPLMGWTAACGHIDAGGLALFAILACWQLPHFLAIAWLYRDDYARGGFVMMPRRDARGLRTALTAAAFAAALLPVALLPAWLRLAGAGYALAAAALGLGFLTLALRFAWARTDARARVLFWSSIVYLPALLALLALDKM